MYCRGIGVQSLRGTLIFSLLHSVQTGFGAYKWAPRGHFSGDKTAGAKNTWIYNSTSPHIYVA
jgi:hypothetical protein